MLYTIKYAKLLFGETMINSDKSWKGKVVPNGYCGRRRYGLLGLPVFIFYVGLIFYMWKIFGGDSNRRVMKRITKRKMSDTCVI